MVTERLKLRNGKWLSIQASIFHYCHPRVDDAETYTSVEVAVIYCGEFQRKCIDGWENWYDGTVYSFIPVAVVNAYIERIGVAE